MDRIHLAGISGSLRQGSLNSGLLRAAFDVLPEGVDLSIVEIGDIPLYNADLDVDGGPAVVRRFKERIASADGLLIATPEYNYSIPGGLKNALDWASRPPATSVLRYKPVGIMGVAGGRFGTVRGQLALRQVFLFTESYVMPKPDLLIPNGRQLFDTHGNLQDDDTRERLRDFLDALVTWTRRMNAGHGGA